MIYLIGKIFIYLLVALGVGAAAGWLWRNLQAVDREAALERQLMESRGRLPQMEEGLRKRDEQLEAAHAELRAREGALSVQAVQAELAEAREALERANKALQAEQRRVEELSRERELQNRALQALEQQLDMARDGHDRVVNG